MGGSKIPVGIPGGIDRIPPGTNPGSQAGLAGSRLTFLPGCPLALKKLGHWTVGRGHFEKFTDDSESTLTPFG